ncbi:hypothetical protein D3OALGB2SA_5837 [Olavius algarvensis associated proteobacterium Delta 3]|nr:hypothetical protein D3OALGB2SA_5837 [Olavius algarvensis associated proteobacterium Delta 3]
MSGVDGLAGFPRATYKRRRSTTNDQMSLLFLLIISLSFIVCDLLFEVCDFLI